MGTFTKLQKVVVGLGAVGGATAYYLINYVQPGREPLFAKQTPKTHASWTSNFTPSVKWDRNWDHRQPESIMAPEKNKKEVKEIANSAEMQKPKSTRHILLIRHGQYNLDGAIDDERHLTPLGIQQAEATGVRLREIGLPYTNIVKSTMLRARQTGDLISKSLPDIPVKECDLLREGAPIPPEPPVGHWKPQPHFFKDGARIEAAFREYFHRAPPEQAIDSYTILVCHANVIRYFVCRALQFPPEAWLRLSLNHGSITWLTITPHGRVILRNLGDCGHMPPKLITSK